MTKPTLSIVSLLVLSLSTFLPSCSISASNAAADKEKERIRVENNNHSPLDLFLSSPHFSLIEPVTSNIINEKNRQYSKKEIECLARNLYFEARGEGEKGMEMVGHVTMNRVKSSRYPNTICGVVHQKSQFSWTNNGGRYLPIKEPKSFALAKLIAKKVASRDENKTHLHGAIYFYHKAITPRWAKHKKQVATYRSHIFRK